MVIAQRLRAYSRAVSVLVAAGGALVLLGWILKNEPLKRVFPGMVAMNPVTSLAFIAAGVSLFCFWIPERSRLLLAPARILPALLMLLGLLKLSAYFFDFHFPFDRLLFPDQIKAESGTFPNQVAPNTAFSFLIAGWALWLLNSRSRKFSRLAQNLSLALLFVSLIPFVGYIYRANYLYGVGPFIPMALHSAVFFLLLGQGLVLTQSSSGIVALFTSQTPGGAVARRLLPFAFLVPLVLGGLAIWGIKLGTYSPQFAVTIVVAGSAAILIALIWRNAWLLNSSDHQRSEAEDRLKKAHAELEHRVEERTGALIELNHILARQVLELQNAQETISEQAELLNKAQDAILVLNPKRQIVFWSKGAERVYGWYANEVLGKVPESLLFGDLPAPSETYAQVMDTGLWTGEAEHVTKFGHRVVTESRWALFRDSLGEPKGILIINTDVTEKRNYQKELLRSQRMESIGALAGGVAHDLNNALTPILIGSQLLRTCEAGDERKKLLELISTSARRGSQMVNQILSFARGSKDKAGPVQLQHLLDEMAKIARDTFPKSIQVEVQRARDLWLVEGDATELHQVLLNLSVNSRDAMPEGGHLTLEAENIRLDEEKHGIGSTIPPGAYVRLSVADTGAGIPNDVLPRIFEPFFTTKPPEIGTGLGLATVAGIVKRHHGFIEIQSEVGQGTKFSIYLPAAESAPAHEPAHPVELPAGSGELILLMEDEQAVRELAKTTLENYGYRVLTAAHGLEGLAHFKKHQEEIKLLVTDTDMPHLDGIKTIRAIQKVAPAIPIIFASGAKRDFDKLTDIDTSHLSSLNKPYTVDQLLRAVAKALSNKRPQSPSTETPPAAASQKCDAVAQ